jgi:hypothetical protein
VIGWGDFRKIADTETTVRVGREERAGRLRVLCRPPG